MRRLLLFSIIFIQATGMIACKKESAVFKAAVLTEYYPLQVGNSYTYRLDSTVYVSFGTVRKINSYVAKDSVVSTFEDNAGRMAYLVYRYLADTLLLHPFLYSSSYYVTPAKNNIQVTDANNLRYINLAAPVTGDNTWQGNAYIDILSDVSPLLYLQNWNYRYEHINMPFAVINGSTDSTITVLQEDSDTPNELIDPLQYQQYIHSAEVYAKGIGLIYKDFDYWTWQPLNSISPGYTAESYGIRLNLISYTIK